MNKNCYIAGAGEFCENTLPGKDDYIIAVDGGYAALIERGITPDLVVGDFDSLPVEFMDLLSGHPNVIRCPAEKDDTDMMIAVEHGLELGYKTFLINGGLGGRLDHTLGNIQVLTYIARKSAWGVLFGNRETVMAFNNTMELKNNVPGSLISIFSADIARRVTIKGLKYTLDDGILSNDHPVGISNEFIGETAFIEAAGDVLIVVTNGMSVYNIEGHEE